MGIGARSTSGYGALSQGNGYDEPDHFHDAGDEEDFFGSYSGGQQQAHQGASLHASSTAAPAAAAPAPKADSWDDEWKDF
jgi:hypothetical protein